MEEKEIIRNAFKVSHSNDGEVDSSVFVSKNDSMNYER